MDEVQKTGTYAMLLANDGTTILEARARKLARKANNRNWRDYLDAAKAEILAEAGYTDPLPTQL